MTKKNQKSLSELREMMAEVIYDPSPTVSTIKTIGKKIAASPLSAEKRRELLAIMFEHIRYQEENEAELNLWAIAVMLEHKSTSIPMKIDAVRRILDDPLITNQQLNQWVEYVFSKPYSIPEDLLIFLASDYRNLAKDRLTLSNLKLLTRFKDKENQKL